MQYYDEELLDLLCDFRCGGCRLLIDIICDLDDLYRNAGIKKNAVRRDDSRDLKKLLNGAMQSADADETIIRNCINILRPLDRRETKIDLEDALKCSVALGERQFVLEVLPGVIYDNAVSDGNEPKKRKTNY